MTPAQCRAARGLLELNQTQLAKMCRLNIATVVDFERHRREVSLVTVAKMQRCLEKAGVEFINGDRPGVRCQERKRRKRRSVP